MKRGRDVPRRAPARAAHEPARPAPRPPGRAREGERSELETRRRALASAALALGLAAIAWGVFGAIRHAWLGDDAFISFRYAENFVRGLGLVYNAGERVEGYSNFLWTMGIVAGMRLGVSPERWSMAWGVVFYAATIAALAWDQRARASVRSLALGAPLAAWLAAAHPDWQIWATSGLETSLFTFLVTIGTLLVMHRERGTAGLVGAGLAFGLAALTRPEGPLFFVVAALWVAWARPPRRASVAWLAGAFLLVFVPYVAWKIGYYGEFLPNTWYAKSAALAWWSQGWIYVRLYFERYWALALAVPLAVIALARRRRAPAERESAALAGDAAREMVLALTIALAYGTYVAKVGGDFMYARLLIPATPFLILALARALEIVMPRPSFQWIAGAVLVAAVALTPRPLGDAEIRDGIVDESTIYTPEALAKTRNEGWLLRRFFDGLPVRIAIVGSQAALAYYARPAVAIECGTGLTDAWIARQPLAKRGRVGHEKIAPISYLLRRKVNFTIHPFAAKTLDLDSELPFANIAFDTVIGRIVTWDPEVLAGVGARGARFKDVPSTLDGYILRVPAMPADQARESFARMKRFYFDVVSDPARERAFLAAVAASEKASH